MASINTTNYLNPAKRNELLSQWCRENLLPADFRRWQKQLVNFATMEEVQKFIFASKTDWIHQIENKNNKDVSSQEFVLDENQKYMRFIFFNNTHYYDVGNHQPLDNRAMFREKLKTSRTDMKTCVIFGGDLLGEEWKMRDFNNAKFSDDKDGQRNFVYTSDEGNVVFYYGLNKRMKELEKDIIIALNSGADVYLMRGAQEHEIYKATGRNILREVYDRLSNTIAKQTKSDLDASKLHYIDEGASLKLNFIRKKPDGSKAYGVIGLQTNNTDKSYTAQGSIRASQKSNGELDCDVKFVTNANVVGNFKDAFYVSGQSVYNRNPQAKKPIPAPRDNDVFVLSMEDSKNIQVRVGDMILDEDAQSVKEEYCELYKNKALLLIAKKKINQKLGEMNGGKQYGA